MESYIGLDMVPRLSVNMSPEEALQKIVPSGFSSIVSVSIDSGDLVLHFVHAEQHNMEIKISQKIFNPKEFGIIFPIFVLEVSSFSNIKIDYFQLPFSNHLLNQNELLWLVLHHRLTMFSRNNVHYSDLVKKDISRISEYTEYTTYSSTNSILKSQNYITILDVWEKGEYNPNLLNWKSYYNGNQVVQLPLGEMLGAVDLDKQKLHAIFRDLPIQPASESMASEKSKFVMSNHFNTFYKCVGYGGLMKRLPNVKSNIDGTYSKDGMYAIIRSIYPTKSNIAARFKSHIVADAYKFSRPSTPIFIEDIVKDNSTDGTLMDAVVVFDHIDEYSGRLLCGEIEASKKFSSTIVHKEEIIRGVFKELMVKEGETYRDRRLVIGISEDDTENVLIGFRSVTIMSISENGIAGAYKIVAKCTRQIGSARIFSHTGLKGVTKPKPDLGKIVFTLPNGSKKKLNVDLVTGMNAVKGKSNTIALAQAALMYRTNQCGDLPYLKSMSQDQINYYASQLNEVVWTDQYGNESIVYAGIIQVSVNELSYMFRNVRPQSFMPESGRYLKHGGHEDLFNHIWETGIDPELKSVIIELQKCLMDNIGFYAEEDGLPIYSPDALRTMKVFDISDIKKERRPIYPHVSKILDEQYNQGFYIDLKYRQGGMIRFPSAKTLNYFTERLASGEWIYPALLVNISKCIEACIVVQENGKANIGFLNDQFGDKVTGKKRKFLIDQYLERVKGLLYKDQNLGSALLKPKVLGVGMKQMTDCHVPRGVVVIMDNYTYRKLKVEAGFDADADIYSFRALCIRNPVVWKSQVQSLHVWNKKQFEEYLLLIEGIEIDKYFMTKFCKEILLMNPEDAIHQQSDVDGDLMPVFVPKGIEAQEMLKTFNPVDIVNHPGVLTVDGVVKEELDWISDYRRVELNGNEDLLLDQSYKLHDLPFCVSPNNGLTFANIFIDSIVAKKDVGLSTHNNWTLQTLAEIYKQECDAGNVVNLNKPGSTELMSITMEEVNLICHYYSRLVQDFVIRGIKHNDGGSDGFKRFLLANMVSADYRKKVAKFFKEELGLESSLINQFFAMVSWAKSHQETTSIMQFISLHNKGKEPVWETVNHDHFNIIVERTFYGQLVKPLYDIRDAVSTARNSGFQYTGTIERGLSSIGNNQFVRTTNIQSMILM